MALLNEMPEMFGHLNINGRLSYVSQEPWLCSGTIKQNILFGKEFDEKKFKEVVECCLLVQVKSKILIQCLPYSYKIIFLGFKKSA